MRFRPVGDSYADWRDRLASANDGAFWPITAIDEMLNAGTAQYWCDGEAALVTHIVEYPGGAVVLEALSAAGDLDALKDQILGDVERWAREQRLSHLLIAGRKGWERVHKDWRHYQSILIKELADGV